MWRWECIRVVAESGSHFCSTVFIIVGLSSLLVGRTHTDGVDAGDIAIGSTGIIIEPTVSCCPYINGPRSIATLHADELNH